MYSYALLWIWLICFLLIVLIFFALHLQQFLVNYIKGELHMGHYITHIPLVQVYK